MEQETASGNGISCTICKSAPRPRQITMPAPPTQFFTDQMPFLPTALKSPHAAYCWMEIWYYCYCCHCWRHVQQLCDVWMMLIVDDDAVLRCDETSCNYILLRLLTADFDVQRFIRDARLLRNQFVSCVDVLFTHCNSLLSVICLNSCFSMLSGFLVLFSKSTVSTYSCIIS